MGITIGASAPTGPRTAVAEGAAGGSRAERAYRQALKQMTQAQQQLAKHAMEHADEDTLKMDQQAVDMAAAALSQAMTAMAKEAQDAADAKKAETPVTDGVAPQQVSVAARPATGPRRGSAAEEPHVPPAREARPASPGAIPEAVDEYL